MAINLETLRETEQSETLLVNEESRLKEEKGEKVFKFGFGQSPFLPPQHVIDVLKKEAARKEYMSVQGLPELRSAVAKFHSEVDGLSISPEQVIVGPGSKMLIFTVMAAFKSADVFLVTPSWVSYEPQAHLAGHPVTRVQTTFEEKWRLTPHKLEQACKERKDQSRPIIMVLNYPGNPDGLTYNESELKELADVMRRYNVLVISDEIYGLLHHTGEHQTLASHYPEGTIITSGLSKWAGAGGWRIGIAIIPKEMGQTFVECLVGIASETYSCVSSPVQLAAVEAYRPSEQINDYLFHQRRILKAVGYFSYAELKIAGVDVHEPDGGFYLNPDFTPLKNKLEAAGITTSPKLCEELLKDTGVVLLPGTAFGYPEDQLVTRLAFVDFDGTSALEASQAFGKEQSIGQEFLEKHTPKIVEGITALRKWVETR